MSINFYKGSQNVLLNKEKIQDQSELDVIRKDFHKVFDVKNLSFLLGAGCSSYKKMIGNPVESIEIGISIMSVLASDFYLTLTDSEKKYIQKTLKIDITSAPFKNNLEKLLELLYSYRFILEKQGLPLVLVDKFIRRITVFLHEKCLNLENNSKYGDLLALYKQFYRKLVFRDSNLSKANIFTTNYDLYSEKALDELGVQYCNGFSGFIERGFNPAMFNYAFAEQMGLSQNKWNVIDNFIYLYKLHGSINWIEAENKKHLFNVIEVQDCNVDSGKMMIYPTPLKYMATLSSPYSDLFREFQKKIMQEKTVLVVMGYSFSDEHINNIIYQALTIPTFRLVVFSDSENAKISQLVSLDDPRIWVIDGELDVDGAMEKVHYFNFIVNNLLPDIGEAKIQESMEKIFASLVNKSNT